MKTIFVKYKSELTAEIDRLAPVVFPVVKDAPEAFRTRLSCNCRYPYSFRYGALIVCNNLITHKVIKCKQCAKGGAL